MPAVLDRIPAHHLKHNTPGVEPAGLRPKAATSCPLRSRLTEAQYGSADGERGKDQRDESGAGKHRDHRDAGVGHAEVTLAIGSVVAVLSRRASGTSDTSAIQVGLVAIEQPVAAAAILTDVGRADLGPAVRRDGTEIHAGFDLRT